MKRILGVFLVSLFLIAGCMSGSSDSSTALGGPTQNKEDGENTYQQATQQDVTLDLDVRYNEVLQKAAHNSYQRDESLLDQMIYHRVRSIEFDLHTWYGDPVFKWGEAPEGDWLMYHHVADMFSRFKFFSQGLYVVKAFHEAIPEHEVVTIFFDIGFDGQHTPEDFDALIRSILPTEAIFTPADLLALCPGATTLKESVTSCGWPTLGELRGKFIFVLTTGSYAGTNREHALERLGFVTGGFEDQNSVFFNTEYKENDPYPAQVHDAGFVSRVYYADSAEKFADAKEQKANHIAINEINYHTYPWSTTCNAVGYPFECIDDPARIPSDYAEVAPIIGIEVNSDGLAWGIRDSFTFLFEERPGSEDGIWTTLIAGPGSSVDPRTKAFLMARVSDDPAAPYFAVIRSGTFWPLKVQYRRIQAFPPVILPGYIAPVGRPQDDAPFVRLELSNGGKCAKGYGSYDGQTWVEIGSCCFAKPLKLQGIGASSGTDQEVKFLFVHVKRQSSTGEVIYTKATFAQAKDIGTVRASRAFDGVFP
jgi:hypothetical protein